MGDGGGEELDFGDGGDGNCAGGGDETGTAAMGNCMRRGDGGGGKDDFGAGGDCNCAGAGGGCPMLSALPVPDSC